MWGNGKEHLKQSQPLLSPMLDTYNNYGYLRGGFNLLKTYPAKTLDSLTPVLLLRDQVKINWKHAISF